MSEHRSQPELLIPQAMLSRAASELSAKYSGGLFPQTVERYVFESYAALRRTSTAPIPNRSPTILSRPLTSSCRWAAVMPAPFAPASRTWTGTSRTPTAGPSPTFAVSETTSTPESANSSPELTSPIPA